MFWWSSMWCFSGSCLVKEHVVFCWSGCLRRHRTFGNSVSTTQQTADDALALVHLAFFSDLCLLWLHREKCTRELLVVFSLLLATLTDSCWLAELWGFFWIEPLLLIPVLCFAGGLDCRQRRLESPQGTTSRQVQIPLVLWAVFPHDLWSVGYKGGWLS